MADVDREANVVATATAAAGTNLGGGANAGGATNLPEAPNARRWIAIEPLRERTFRTIWIASLMSNFGYLILGVGAAWEMTKLAPTKPEMVALVQSAMMLPLMLVSVPSGAIADMFDRRKVAITGLAVSVVFAAMMTVLAFFHLTSPWVLLAFCALIGMGGAIYSPAWQASVAEQVEPDHLPAAIALGSISYNVARSFGPAIGGLVVVAAGATAAFAINAVFYLPLLLAFFFWRRVRAPSRLPPERMDRAIVAGARYVLNAPPIRTVLIRVLTFGLGGASVAALTPLVARDLLGGDASTYGLLLGAYGVGAVGGALMVGNVRERYPAEASVRFLAIGTGLMVVLVGFSNNLLFTCAAMLVAGGLWMLLVALLNVGVQLSSPRWVAARALSWFQASMTGGAAIGAWLWGTAAADWGVGNALIVSGVVMTFLPLLGLVLPMPAVTLSEVELVELRNEPEVALAITARSGPIVIELDYRVDPEEARPFYEAMQALHRARKRNGAFAWSLARDIADPAAWTESYHCPTWADYLRLRSRFTHADRALQEAADAFHRDDGRPRVRRRLERPFGSVRWRADTPDLQRDAISPYAP